MESNPNYPSAPAGPCFLRPEPQVPNQRGWLRHSTVFAGMERLQEDKMSAEILDSAVRGVVFELDRLYHRAIVIWNGIAGASNSTFDAQSDGSPDRKDLIFQRLVGITKNISLTEERLAAAKEAAQLRLREKGLDQEILKILAAATKWELYTNTKGYYAILNQAIQTNVEFENFIFRDPQYTKAKCYLTILEAEIAGSNVEQPLRKEFDKIANHFRSLFASPKHVRHVFQQYATGNMLCHRNHENLVKAGAFGELADTLHEDYKNLHLQPYESPYRAELFVLLNQIKDLYFEYFEWNDTSHFVLKSHYVLVREESLQEAPNRKTFNEVVAKGKGLEEKKHQPWDVALAFGATEVQPSVGETPGKDSFLISNADQKLTGNAESEACKDAQATIQSSKDEAAANTEPPGLLANIISDLRAQVSTLHTHLQTQNAKLVEIIVREKLIKGSIKVQHATALTAIRERDERIASLEKELRDKGKAIERLRGDVRGSIEEYGQDADIDSDYEIVSIEQE